MTKKKFFSYSIKIIVAIIVASVFVYHFDQGVFLRLNKQQPSHYNSLQNLEIVNVKLLNQNTLCSFTDDSQIILKDINWYIQSVSVQVEETSQKDFTMQVYYDTGHGYNEKESVVISGKAGTNIIPLNCHRLIHSIRIDPTNSANHRLTLENIDLKPGLSALTVQILNITYILCNYALLLFVALFYARRESRIFRALSFVFYTALLYVANQFWLIKASLIYNVMFFVILCLFMIVLPLIWREVKKIDKRTTED